MALMLQPINFAVLERCPYNYMKPLSQISRQLRPLHAEQTPSWSQVKHPVTDCYYQAAGGDPRAAKESRKLTKPLLSPSFRDLSNEFLGAETKRNYVAEAFFFAIIVGVSAWPIVTMIQALSQLMK
jgi:hypothetical protein